MKEDSTKINEYSFEFQIPPRQAELSKKLVQALTINNLNWLDKISTNLPNSTGYQYLKQHSKQYLYILLHGLPSLVTQFDFLDLPGQILHVYPQGFDPELKNKQQKIEAFKNADLSKQAEILQAKLSDHKYQNKKHIFVVHSFGTFIMAKYFYMFGAKNTIGIISIAQTPLRLYKTIQQLLYMTTQQFQGPSLQQFLLENAQLFLQVSNQNAKKNGYSVMKDKYEAISFFNAIPSIRNCFIHLRTNMPKILKLIVYGTLDQLFQNKNINETGIYYSYVHKIDQEQNKFYSQYLEKKYKSIDSKFNISIREAQPRFLYYLQKGRHSIHYQSKFRNIIKRATQEYLDAIGMMQKSKN